MKNKYFLLKKVDYGVKKIYFLEKYEHKSRKKAQIFAFKNNIVQRYRNIIMLFVYLCLHFVALDAEKMTDEVLG
ncbi:MAG: hypothetical protein SPD44_09460 [Prevotella sp.]|nr:hypothetical protein [Prevotella sp.]MCI6805413.1 hypothetical protein [Prevotella sp.]MCI7452767.1 hypothetical protein [Prevotella sp.]MCI7496206.1 hypothetical protein [Prevotella sp.]MDY3964960.1 hypothetical protein [Prevotella sp.]